MEEAPVPLAPPAECATLRCPLGRCLEAGEVCDGVPHCRDASDEQPLFCAEWQQRCARAVDPFACACAADEMRCDNGRCVEKAAFCDGADDCGDASDEPGDCSCAAFLRLSAPRLLCDGRRNCLDKSDEARCGCGAHSFHCTRSGTCIASELVCDGEPDCPGKEDEEHCWELSISGNSPTTREVRRRSYGSWHSYCAAEGEEEHFSDLCKTIGFTKMSNFTVIKHQSPNEDVQLPHLFPFTTARLNNKTEIILRGDHPLVGLKSLKEGECNMLLLTCV
ncbi:Serine protease nudel [Gryllus bimaculatus]|nr:Serine protease nudel [Gryllus bimaculatus]